MKANELMIGDWVKDSTNCKVRFDGIGCSDYNEINRNNGYPIRCDDEDDRFVGIINSEQKRIYYEHLADLQPIPLTEEMLEANGFRESIEEGTYYFPERYEELNVRGFAVETDGTGRWMITDHQLMVFRYVHELQRLLRCCGLTDLADNFEIN